MPDISTQLRDYLEETTTPVAAREIIMGTEFKEVEAAPPPGIRWGTLASVAALVAVVVGVVWALSPGGGFAPAADPVHPDVAVVEAAIAAYNDHDEAALWEYLDGEEDDLFEWTFGPPPFIDTKFVANTRITVDSCEPANPGFVICDWSETNDYWEPAGLSWDNRYILGIEGGRIASILIEEDYGGGEGPDLAAYGNDVLTWLSVAHPDVYRELPVLNSYDMAIGRMHPPALSSSNLPNAEAMPTVLDYLDQFMDQSLSYPVDP